MYSQPDGFSAGSRPFDPVTAVGRNQQVIARFQIDGLRILLKGQCSLTLNQKYPLIPVLVIPFSDWRYMAFGNNPFDLDASSI